MTTFVTILTVAAIALPLVVLALRGTRADPYRGVGPRPTRDALGWTVVAGPHDLDAARAARDLDAVRAHRAEPDAGPAPAPHAARRATAASRTGARGSVPGAAPELAALPCETTGASPA